MVQRAVFEVTGGASATQGKIGIHVGPTPNEGRSGSWIHTIRVVEEVIATYHHEHLERDCTVRAPDGVKMTVEFQARVRALDDAYGPPGPDRTAA